ncbi:tetratricopeptide repeat protein [Desulfovibrio sp.]|uniref:tetratricopeptide repeat protein n=1 Tax=Desulfovibrio sp. TaxID=885 RepID=UPI0023C81EC2|nr:tetratricopeptide repeat protein [Desulfovibrio sp.]MDE7241715.1 tetratricopeptide repeat protein [Desulfovibrio sp.]
MRLSTCIAGMVLTLVLGLYLGTLLPGVLRDMRGQATQAQEVAAAPALMAPGDTTPPTPGPAAPQVAESGPPHPGTSGSAAAGLPPGLAARLSELEAAVRKDPASAANWTELGNLFFDAGRVHEAINAYERSLAIAPGNADVLTDLGIMYRENDAPEKAVDCFRKALAAEPRHENALFNAGVVLYTDLGRKDEAVAAWRRLLALNPQARAPDGRTVLEMVRRLEEPPRR